MNLIRLKQIYNLSIDQTASKSSQRIYGYICRFFLIVFFVLLLKSSSTLAKSSASDKRNLTIDSSDVRIDSYEDKSRKINSNNKNKINLPYLNSNSKRVWSSDIGRGGSEHQLLNLKGNANSQQRPALNESQFVDADHIHRNQRRRRRRHRHHHQHHQNNYNSESKSHSQRSLNLNLSVNDEALLYAHAATQERKF
jgi:hypothetical protein